MLRGPGSIGHMTFQEVQQFLKAGVDKFPVGVTPLAVLLVEGAVRLPADIDVLQGIPQHWQISCLGEPNRVLMETSNSPESSFKVSVLGTVSPVSQRETA